jgi:Tfp pilus assembly protein PilW
MTTMHARHRQPLASAAGYSIVELMISVGIMLIVSTGVFQGLMKISQVQGTVTNRSELHSGVRNATELLQQEVGQAGRLATPVPITISSTTPVAAGNTTATLNSVSGLYPGEKLVFGAGATAPAVATEETLTIASINVSSKVITLSTAFDYAHPVNQSVRIQGGFHAGVVPTNTTNGSTATKLKIFGDINGDGNMVYVEYTCDATSGNLYRNSMAYDTLPANKPAVSPSIALLNNIKANPDGTACFVYQQQAVAGITYVTDVAITLTVETADVDPVTKRKQTETKALLNVSPRNVFNVWQLAGLNITNRIQNTPPTVTALLP